MPDPSSSRQDAQYKHWRWRIFFITWLTYAGFYLTRKSFSVAKIGMEKDPSIQMDPAMMGALDASYLIAYAIGQFVWGMSADRLGTRKVVLGGLLTSVVAGVALGFSSASLMFGGLLFVQGVAQSTGWAPLTKNVSFWFPQKQRGVIYGFWSTNYAVGGLIASPIAGYIAVHFGHWRYAFWGPAIILLGVWLLFLVMQRNQPEDVGLPPVDGEEDADSEANTASDDSETKPSSRQASLKVLKNTQVLIMAASYFFLKPTRYAIIFWGPYMVNKKLGTNELDSAITSAIFDGAGVFGALTAGIVSDKLFNSRRMPVCVVLLAILAVILFMFDTFTSTGSHLAMGILLFAIGFFIYGPDSILAGVAAVDFGTSKGAGTSAGFINGCGSVGAILGGSLPGVIYAQYGWGTLFNILGVSVLMATILLAFRWNAVPATQTETTS